MNWRIIITLALLLTFSSHPLLANQADSTTDSPNALHNERGRYNIHLVIMGNGDDLFARFGHIAIVVEDTLKDRATVYNYGTFEFDDRKLMFKYARGYLRFWLGTVSYKRTVRLYSLIDRQLERYTLNLTPKEAEDVANFLMENAKPQNRTYDYRHYLDNCCTRIRNIIDELTGGDLKASTSQNLSSHTYRYWTRKALTNMPVMGFLIDYVLGQEIDRPITRWEEYFLPMVLQEDLPTIKLPDGRDLVKEHQTVYARRGIDPSSHPPTWELITTIVLFVLIFLTLILPVILGPRKWAKRLFATGLTLWGGLIGLGGLILILFLFTAHLDTHWNENVIVTPVSHFILIWGAFTLLRGRQNIANRFNKISLYLYIHSAILLIMMLLKVGPLIQQNWGLLFTILLSNIWLAVVAIPRLQLGNRDLRSFLCKKNG